MHGPGCQKVPSTPSLSDREERAPHLHWESTDNDQAALGDGTCQKKKEKWSSPLLEMRTCEDPLANGEQCPGQSHCLEVKRALPRKAKGDPSLLQGGDLLAQKDQLDSGSLRLDFESESVHEEIYWGCFYFFPWLRMCKRDKKEQPS